MTTEIRTMSVPFHGTTLFLIEQNNEPYTPMKPIVEGMGLGWSGQHEKLNLNKDRWGIRVNRIQTPGDDQIRETVMMPLRKLPGWLMTIHPTRVKPEIREKIIQYQNECDDVLWKYWTEGLVTNPRISIVTPAPPAVDPLDRTLEREQIRLETMRLRTDRVMKLKKMILEFRDREIFGLAEARKAALSAVRLLTGEDPSGPTPGLEEPIPAEEDSALLADVCRALALEKEPTDIVSLMWGLHSGLDPWLLGRGILPTSRARVACLRIGEKISKISHKIRDRILEEERRIPSFEETLEEAVKQFLEGREG
ncbi:MAG: phage antirepressor N-terminal domain-containing protein [Leptospirales bacterium]